jgi:hypothetical protein
VRAQQQQQQQQQPSASSAQPAASEYRPETPLTSWDKISAEDIDSWDEQTGPATPLLDTVEYPVHIKNFNSQQLKQLCKELRSDVVHTVSQTGGHLSSSLGVVELTVAMHYVFNAPDDKIIFDVGHQCYIHKMLTGRRKQMRTIRQTNGLSGAGWSGRGAGVRRREGLQHPGANVSNGAEAQGSVHGSFSACVGYWETHRAEPANQHSSNGLVFGRRGRIING